MTGVAIRDPQVPNIAGITPTYNAASAGGDKVQPGSLVLVKNASGAGITLTIPTPGTAYGQAIADASITIGAGAEKSILIPEDGYTGTDGYADLSWSATTSVTFSAQKAWDI